MDKVHPVSAIQLCYFEFRQMCNMSRTPDQDGEWKNTVALLQIQPFSSKSTKQRCHGKTSAKTVRSCKIEGSTVEAGSKRTFICTLTRKWKHLGTQCRRQQFFHCILDAKPRSCICILKWKGKVLHRRKQRRLKKHKRTNAPIGLFRSVYIHAWYGQCFDHTVRIWSFFDNYALLPNTAIKPICGAILSI